MVPLSVSALPGPAVLTGRTVQPLWRLALSSLRESKKGAKKRNKKLSAWLGKNMAFLGKTNSKQFSWTKTSL